MSPNKKNNLKKFKLRCLNIINGKRINGKLPSINHTRKEVCAIEAFKCLNGISPPDYTKYFKRLDHCKGTRGNKHSLLLPKENSGAYRITLKFLGA